MRKSPLFLSLLLLLCTLSKVSAQDAQLEAMPASAEEAATIGRGADLAMTLVMAEGESNSLRRIIIL